MGFKFADSISTTFKTFSENAGYVLLRMLAQMAILIVLLLVVGGILGFVFIGVVFSTTPIVGFNFIPTVPTYLSGFIAVFGIFSLIFGTMLQLGLLRSLMRLVVSGEKRYDMFAPLGKTMQYLVVVVLFWLAYVAVLTLLSRVLGVSLILGVIVIVIACLLIFWYLLQLTFVPYRMFGYDEDVVTALKGSYRMLGGSRWAFVCSVIGVVVPFTVVTVMLNLTPVIGWLLGAMVNFFATPLFVLWYAVIHQQLDATERVA